MRVDQRISLLREILSYYTGEASNLSVSSGFALRSTSPYTGVAGNLSVSSGFALRSTSPYTG